MTLKIAFAGLGILCAVASFLFTGLPLVAVGVIFVGIAVIV